VPFYIPLIAMMLMLPIVWLKFRLPKTPDAEEPAPAASPAE
jgi:hypothetical protein